MSERRIVTATPSGTDRGLTEALRECADQSGLADGWVLVLNVNPGESTADVLAGIAAHLGVQAPDDDNSDDHHDDDQEHEA